MSRKQKRRTKFHLPQILRQPIVINVCDERRFRDGLTHEMGQRLAAVCQYFGHSVLEVDLQGPTGTLVFKMAEHCFPEAFRIVSDSEAQRIKIRKHLWTDPRKRALIALVDEYKAKGCSNIKTALKAAKDHYRDAPPDLNYLRGDVSSLVTRYHEFKRWAEKNPGGVGMPLNPDGEINFRALATQFIYLQDNYENQDR